MRVGVFVAFAGRRAGGPETYELNIVRELANVGGDDELHVYCFSPDAARSFAIEAPNVRFHVLWPPVRYVNVSLSLPLCLLRERLDVCHATSIPPLYWPGKSVFTMYDVTPFANPEFYPPRVQRNLAVLIRRGLASADHIICISDNTRETTAELLGVPRERMSVVHLGISDSFRPMSRTDARARLAHLGVPERFLLYAGKLIVSKNFVRLLEAFARARPSIDPELKLVAAGPRGRVPAEWHGTIAALGLQNYVIDVGYVAEADMPALYAAADTFVFPSLWEGFGLPVVESMACGTPVITSNVACLPEIAGDAALLVDPLSVDAIADAMVALATDPKLRERQRERGLARAAHFSWRRAAEETLAIYRRFARRAP